MATATTAPNTNYNKHEKREEKNDNRHKTLATSTIIQRAVLKLLRSSSQCIVLCMYADNIRSTENIKYENSAFRRHIHTATVTYTFMAKRKKQNIDEAKNETRTKHQRYADQAASIHIKWGGYLKSKLA